MRVNKDKIIFLLPVAIQIGVLVKSNIKVVKKYVYIIQGKRYFMSAWPERLSFIGSLMFSGGVQRDRGHHYFSVSDKMVV